MHVFHFVLEIGLEPDEVLDLRKNEMNVVHFMKV